VRRAGAAARTRSGATAELFIRAAIAAVCVAWRRRRWEFGEEKKLPPPYLSQLRVKCGHDVQHFGVK
jgi:hypothetical protein